MSLTRTPITISAPAIRRLNMCTERIAGAADLRERTYWMSRQNAALDGLFTGEITAGEKTETAFSIILHASVPDETLSQLIQVLAPLRDNIEVIMTAPSRNGAPASCEHAAQSRLATVFSAVRLLTWTAEASESDVARQAAGAALAAALRAARGLTIAVNPEPEAFLRLIAALEAHPEASIATTSPVGPQGAIDTNLSRSVWRTWIHARCGYPSCADHSAAMATVLRLAAQETAILAEVSKDIRPEVLPVTPPCTPMTGRRVSIIIPVFNNAQYTRQCLAALKAHTSYSDYEIIVIDNASSDETQPMLSARKDITVIRNTTNKGFTEACNQGAQAAAGEYLLFLNNDTIPLAGWLEPLVRLLDDTPWIGAAGSRLIYPDGTLQEAGAVVHNDGSASNFGRHEHPAHPSFNRPCEVDYCSGASLLVRTALFRELGGFDMRYSPAYYEETDLCFAMREVGKAVAYEPASTVIHFGSTTAGLDPTKGIRRHLIINRETFRNKWEHRLTAHEPPPTSGCRVVTNDRALLGRRIGPAAQRMPCTSTPAAPIDMTTQVTDTQQSIVTKRSPRLCIVSDFMPRFDASSSHLRVFRLMGLMRCLGWEIEYLYFSDTPRDSHYAATSGPGVNFRRTGADAASLRTAIDEIHPECLWLTNIWTIDWAAQALQLVRGLRIRKTKDRPPLRIIVDTMDFHAKKHQRRYASEHAVDSLHTAKAFLSLERTLYPLADAVITVTAEEARDILAAVPDCAPTTVIPNIHEPSATVAGLTGRRHMVFLGNYSVQHNRDAAAWFVTHVLPLVRTVRPDVEFHLVGAQAQACCEALAAVDGVRLIGFVPSVEETLARYRVFTCPLTYGAGMKGKVGSAAACGLPIVTTTIGAEGFSFVSEENCIIADTAQDFATACLTLLRDDTLWTKISQASSEVVTKACGTDMALRALEIVLPKTNGSSPGTSFRADATETSSTTADAPPASAPDTVHEPADARLLAFYLPQFHRIPENDMWWGKGFTDWDNVRRTVPAFSGHDQPLAPGELGWYDLSDVNVMRAQANLARQHGVHGFCFYHYWFHGRRILETPLENYLASDIRLPFCLCWANENWSRNWDGGNRELLLEQRHSPEDDAAHFRLLLRFMQDPRYIRVHGKPLLLVYRTRLLPDPAATATHWRIMAERAGLPGLHLCKVEGMSAERDIPCDVGFDAAVEFQPDWTNLGEARREAAFGEHRVYDYDAFVARQLAKPTVSYRRYPCVTPRWDNTPRRPKDSVVLLGPSPDRYRRWLSHVVESTLSLPHDERLIFINAWNEWGEGSALEPDLLRGNAYLEATASALDARIRALDLQLERRLNELDQTRRKADVQTHASVCYAYGFVGGSDETGRWMGAEARLDIVPPPTGGRLELIVTTGSPTLYDGTVPAVTMAIGGTKLPFPLHDQPSPKNRDTLAHAVAAGVSGQATFDIGPDQSPFDIILGADRQFVPVEKGLSQERAARSVQVLARFLEGGAS